MADQYAQRDMLDELCIEPSEMEKLLRDPNLAL